MTADEWASAKGTFENLEWKDAMAHPTSEEASFQSKLQKFPAKRKAGSLEIRQSPMWKIWEPIDNIGPVNLNDAPVFLRMGEDDYWMFGRYRGKKRKGQKGKPAPDEFQPEKATLEGFDIELFTTPYANQFNAAGGLKPGKGGYHA